MPSPDCHNSWQTYIARRFLSPVQRVYDRTPLPGRNPSATQTEDHISSEIDEVAPNRFADALLIQQGASNPSGVTRTLVRAINACHRESILPREDPAVQLIVHQLAHICGTCRLRFLGRLWALDPRATTKSAANSLARSNASR